VGGRQGKVVLNVKRFHSGESKKQRTKKQKKFLILRNWAKKERGAEKKKNRKQGSPPDRNERCSLKKQHENKRQGVKKKTGKASDNGKIAESRKSKKPGGFRTITWELKEAGQKGRGEKELLLH